MRALRLLCEECQTKLLYHSEIRKTNGEDVLTYVELCPQCKKKFNEEKEHGEETKETDGT